MGAQIKREVPPAGKKKNAVLPPRKIPKNGQGARTEGKILAVKRWWSGPSGGQTLGGRKGPGRKEKCFKGGKTTNFAMVNKRRQVVKGACPVQRTA